MRNLKAITLVAILLLQASCLLATDLAQLVATSAPEVEAELSEAVNVAGNLIEEIEYANQDELGAAIDKFLSEPNMAYGWHGQMKITKFLASITVDVDLKANLGKEQLNFHGAGAGSFSKASYEGAVYAGFAQAPKDLFGKLGFALHYDSRDIPSIGNVKGIAIALSKTSDPTTILGVIISPADDQAVSAVGQGTLKQKE